jgi:hypothetical protein
MHCAKNTCKTEAFCFGCALEKKEKNTVATLMSAALFRAQKVKKLWIYIPHSGEEPFLAFSP